MEVYGQADWCNGEFFNSKTIYKHGYVDMRSNQSTLTDSFQKNPAFFWIAKRRLCNSKLLPLLPPRDWAVLTGCPPWWPRNLSLTKLIIKYIRVKTAPGEDAQGRNIGEQLKFLKDEWKKYSHRLSLWNCILPTLWQYFQNNLEHFSSRE